MTKESRLAVAVCLASAKPEQPSLPGIAATCNWNEAAQDKKAGKKAQRH